LVVIIMLIAGGYIMYTFIKPLECERNEILSVHMTHTPQETPYVLEHFSEQQMENYNEFR
jgi:hypothetical protein